MSFIADILGSSLGKTVEGIGKTVRSFVTTDGDRQAMQLELEALLQKRDSEVEQTIRTELQAKEKIIVAELQQGDNYTKRARPTVVYFGLLVILYNYCVIPTIQMFNRDPLIQFILPTEFWVAWGGIVATWSVGRSSEKRGVRNKVTSFITGS
ncbi:hypothetical protein KAR91_34505 [Candidatus Pacearchaeota archaeon]|nr:hypothetical protein [Candidatus Pacearchaeota archaeon]